MHGVTVSPPRRVVGPSVLLGQVEDAGRRSCRSISWSAVDQLVEHLGGDRDEAAGAGTVLDGGQGVGAELLDGAAVLFAFVVGDDRLGLDDGGLELAGAGPAARRPADSICGLQRVDLVGERLDLGLELGQGLRPASRSAS